ncbi:MAG: discoidin domain-containing protein [Phycisphaeraceae bacterium]|nr:discoidin domain-containing protein [Phycisphaeraceae bacterium]
MMKPSLIPCVLVLGMSLVCAAVTSSSSMVEADWAWQFSHREPAFQAPSGMTGSHIVLPSEDAAGGCDGVKTGTFGFHTAFEDNPWWQVDLQTPCDLHTIIMTNRGDGFADRAAHLKISVATVADQFSLVYQHNGAVFAGQGQGTPLTVDLKGTRARWLRIQVPGRTYFHLDEVEVYGENHARNMALGKPATQSSVSEWSTKASGLPGKVDVIRVIDRGLKLANHLAAQGVTVDQYQTRLAKMRRRAEAGEFSDPKRLQAAYPAMRRVTRGLALQNPVLDFDSILFVKRKPSMFPHLSDQYYGWWSRPGGGIYVLKQFKQKNPDLTCLTEGWAEGNFLRPDLSYDAKKVVFAWARYYEHVANIRDKVDKTNLPKDAFYHIFEMSIDGKDVRQLTHGRYDDFDARYLPDGRIAFLSTRKGQFLQTSIANTQKTLTADLPDSYVRCGGDEYRPVPVFTLHAMGPSGQDMHPISAFETFEYTPAVGNDGRLLYCRWDYIDRFNGHFFSLWSSHPNGTHGDLVYGNYTQSPQATMEPRPIPGSDKIVFTAAAHHSITGGSLVLLDRTRGTEGTAPITRLTPEVPFPEAEKNINMFYANPWPLSETSYLVSWSHQILPPHRRIGLDHSVNGQGIYLYDAFGNLDLLYRDPAISCMYPIPVKPRTKPFPLPEPIKSDEENGLIFVQDVQQGLTGVPASAVKRLRIVGVVPKVQPRMNQPCLGVSSEETGKYVLGTVPVEEDGSAYFVVPAGVSVFFQALDDQGRALQTMRSLTYVQPGQTLSCVGCHESREAAPARAARPMALTREPSRLTPPPAGAWPLDYAHLVQPLWDRACVECHSAQGDDPKAVALDLDAEASFDTLLDFANKDLRDLVFEKDRSIAGQGPALDSLFMKFLDSDKKHATYLTPDERYRLALWMDTYALKQGYFSDAQKQQLVAFREQLQMLFDTP